jgi:diacylglycerol kinase
MKIHLVAAVLAFSAAAIFKISRLEIALIAIAVALVLIAELLNSAVEKTVDLVTCEYNPLAGLAKDAAAGAVLLAALFSAAVGILVFYPYIIKILRGVAEWITALR